MNELMIKYKQRTVQVIVKVIPIELRGKVLLMKRMEKIMDVYPNPAATGAIIIYPKEWEVRNVEVYDAIGHKTKGIKNIYNSKFIIISDLDFYHGINNHVIYGKNVTIIIAIVLTLTQILI